MFQKTIVLCCVGLVLLFNNNANAQTVKKQPASNAKPVGHHIQITLKPYKNTKVYLGTNYGQNKYIKVKNKKQI